ncbi:MAG: hypothetical protein AAGC60_27925 [Acidobacteriota bacterium]
MAEHYDIDLGFVWSAPRRGPARPMLSRLIHTSADGGAKQRFWPYDRFGRGDQIRFRLFQIRHDGLRSLDDVQLHDTVACIDIHFSNYDPVPGAPAGPFGPEASAATINFEARSVSGLSSPAWGDGPGWQEPSAHTLTETGIFGFTVCVSLVFEGDLPAGEPRYRSFVLPDPEMVVGDGDNPPLPRSR